MEGVWPTLPARAQDQFGQPTQSATCLHLSAPLHQKPTACCICESPGSANFPYFTDSEGNQFAMRSLWPAPGFRWIEQKASRRPGISSVMHLCLERRLPDARYAAHWDSPDLAGDRTEDSQRLHLIGDEPHNSAYIRTGRTRTLVEGAGLSIDFTVRRGCSAMRRPANSGSLERQNHDQRAERSGERPASSDEDR